MASQTITKGGLSATVDHKGAQLTSLKLGGLEYLWQADEKWWPRSAPVLFPIVGSLRGGFATCGAGECHMGRHGIARNFEHEVVGNSGDAVTFRLDSTPETRESYPYDFRLEMTYALEGEATLAQTFSVTNTGDVDLPFFCGGHPAFNVPLVEGEAFEDYALRFERPWTATSPVLSADGLQDYENMIALVEDSDSLPLTHGLFDNDSFMLTDVPGSTVTMGGPSGHGVRVDFEGFSYIGVWSALPAADGAPTPFVALEPWCGCATRTDEDDVFEHKQGLLMAKPGQTVTKTFRITLL